MRQDGWAVLHWAADAGKQMSVRLLLQRQCDPNIRSAMALTPLHVATSHGWSEVAEELMRFKANPRLKDANGQSALHVAAKKQDYKTLQLLRHGVE